MRKINQEIFSRPPYFPMMYDIQDKNILIVGGGHVGARRAETLLRCGAKITAVSPSFCNEFPEGVRRVQRTFKISDLELEEKIFFIVAATNDREVNKKISEAAHEKKIPVNVCDSQSECDFFFPSLISHGAFGVSVCSAGRSISLTKKFSDFLRKILPAWIKNYES